MRHEVTLARENLRPSFHNLTIAGDHHSSFDDEVHFHVFVTAEGALTFRSLGFIRFGSIARG